MVQKVVQWIQRHGSEIGIPVIIIILNFLVKIWFIDSRDIAMDEPFTLFYSQSGLHSIFSILPSENNPPLYFILMHYWIKIAGISAFAVRFPAFLFSVTTALVMYETGRRFFTWRVGLLASGLYTFSNYHLLFAHEARVYAFFTLMAALSMFFFLCLYQGKHKIRDMILMTLTNLVLVYAHFFGFFMILIQMLGVIMIKVLRGNILKMTFLSAGLTLVGFMPYLGIGLSRFTSSAGGTWVQKPVFSDLYTMLWRYCNAPVVTVVFLLVIAVGGIAYFVNKKAINHFNPNSGVILIWFLFPFLFMFGISFFLPVFLDRYTVFISLPFYFIVALSLNHVFQRKWIREFMALSLILMMIITFTPNVDNKRRLKELVRKTNSLKREKTMVVLCPEWLKYGYAYHAEPEIFSDFNHFQYRLRQAGIYPANQLTELDTGLVNQARNVVYIEEWSVIADREGNIGKYLLSHFSEHQSWHVYESFIITDFRK